MKPTKHFILLTLFLVTIFSCNQSPNEQPTKKGSEYSSEIMKIIKEKNAEITKLYANGQIDEAALHFADDCIQMPPNQPAIRGIEEFKNSWKQNVQFGKWEFNLVTQEVKAQDHMATELGKYTLTFTPNDGSPIPAMTDKGNYVVLWEKIDGDWKAVWDAPVSELPPAALMSEALEEQE